MLRLSSKAHWDVPVILPGGARLHLLASHPTPPVFDGPERRNLRRNGDEIRFWTLYLDGLALRDDQGREAPAPDAPLVVLGDLNADPLDGDGLHEAVAGCWRIRGCRTRAPASAGGAAAGEGGANARHRGPAAAGHGRLARRSRAREPAGGLCAALGRPAGDGGGDLLAVPGRSDGRGGRSRLAAPPGLGGPGAARSRASGRQRPLPPTPPPANQPNPPLTSPPSSRPAPPPPSSTGRISG